MKEVWYQPEINEFGILFHKYGDKVGFRAEYPEVYFFESLTQARACLLKNDWHFIGDL